MEKKKALILATVASMIDQFNRNNIRVLQELGYEVDVACNFENGSATSQDRVNTFKEELALSKINAYHIPIPRNPSKFKNLVKSYKMVKKLINQNGYDIVHCHTPVGGVIGRLTARRARKNGLKVIYTAHGFHFYKGAPILNWLIYYPVEKLCARYTDCLITINKEDYWLAQNRKFAAKNIEYVPGIGIDTDIFNQISTDVNAKKTEFGITDECVLISVGELNENKNHETIIKALSMIKSPVKYIICGKGDRLGYLQELAKKLQVEDKVIFAGFRNDIRELLKISDIFCFPSYREGLSVALMEAMAAGLPIVCSDIRGNNDLIQNGEGGYLVDPANVKGFAESIINMINQDRKSIAKINLEIIKNFDTKCVTKKMKQIYKDINL
jgi:glycosyltransferase involved in cell wall biosynthesis